MAEAPLLGVPFWGGAALPGGADPPGAEGSVQDRTEGSPEGEGNGKLDFSTIQCSGDVTAHLPGPPTAPIRRFIHVYLLPAAPCVRAPAQPALFVCCHRGNSLPEPQGSWCPAEVPE